MPRRFTDENGDRVLAFTSKARNLSRIAELTESIIEIADSGAWRDYRTAVGRDQWLGSEFDYFLISCDLNFDDVSRVIASSRAGAQLAPLMDRDANSEQRRPLEQAAAAWHAAGPEGLVEQASRNGWLGARGNVASPVPERARTRARHGVTKDEHARRSRAERITVKRRRELDELARSVRAELADEHEQRYLVDQLRIRGARGGRPDTRETDLARQRVDAERLGWNTAALAREWGVAERTAQHRVRRLREQL